MPGEAAAEGETDATELDLESIFRSEYERTARLISRVIGNPARAEELAVEVFLKLWRSQRVPAENATGWLRRVALHTALDELRRQARRVRYEPLLNLMRGSPTPEQVHAATEEQNRVRYVLGVLKRRQAELLVLQSDGYTYGEMAAALEINPASVGTLLSRAQRAFREEYIKRYGQG